MILYHGSNIIVKDPRIIETERARDFGAGFYLTPIKAQAEKWAKIKVLRENKGQATVSCFLWDEDLSKVEHQEFDNPDKEWLEFIVKCRGDYKFKHGYDIVQGKIADDSVGETVNFYLDGVITQEQAIAKLKYQKINSQIAFCTEKSLKFIKFKESYLVK